MYSLNEIREIYKMLGDEKSKEVFNCRLLYSLTGDETALDPIIQAARDRVVKSDAFLALQNKLLERAGENYIFGTGFFGRLLFELMPDANWKGFVDNRFTGTLYDKSVLRPEELKGNVTACVAISSNYFYDEMKECLKASGLSEEQILDGTVVYDLTEGSQYFDLEGVDYSKMRTFVDGGCFDGATAIQFAEVSENTEKVWCVEADKRNVGRIESKLSGINGFPYEIIEKGIWSETKVLKFAGGKAGGSYIADGEEENEEVIDEIDAVALDDILLNEKVDMIKFDIEGAELQGLQGAKELIRTQKPFLAICVYHKPEDIIEIPKYIRSINDEYKFYLRHYSFEATETVLYAL